MVKPIVKLVGKDGNIFNSLGLAKKALCMVDLKKEAEELTKKVFKCSSYDEALTLISEYCDIV